MLRSLGLPGVLILIGLIGAFSTGFSAERSLSYRITYATYIGGSEAEEARAAVF